MKKTIIAFAACAAISFSPLLVLGEETQNPTDVPAAPADTIAPEIIAPSDQTFFVDSFPASPSVIPASATDETDPNPTITYEPTAFDEGTTTVTWTAKDASGNEASTTSQVGVFRSPQIPPASTPQTAMLTIRDGDVTAFSGTVELPAEDAENVSISPTHSSTSVSVPARSLLALIAALDATTDSFDITDLQYFASFDSFLINCMAVPSGATPDCFSWTYAVNGSFPQIGLDHQQIDNGDVAYVFFGPQRQTTISTSTVAAGESFVATAKKYDLDSGVYVPAPGVTIGVGTQNPDFSFTTLAATTSDSNGQASFALAATGTFSVGIAEDGFFPAATIMITDAPTSTATTTPPAPPQNGGGGGGLVHPPFNLINALQFLSSKQGPDGSYDAGGDTALSDWTAIAFSASDPGSAKAKLRSYLLATKPSLSSATDYERHAMALEALGIDPYSGAGADYITPIVNEFNGTSIEGPVQANIFAIFALSHAGYAPSDPMMAKIARYIIDASQGGSWGDPDTTAAAIQALGIFFGQPGVDQGKLGQTLGMAIGNLASSQQDDGGWLNADSTSWVQIMLNAVKEGDPGQAAGVIAALTKPNGSIPMDYIARAQQGDGSVIWAPGDTSNHVWSTGYAVTAASGKSWLSILQSFQKPAAPPGGGGGGGIVLGASTSTTATSSPMIATTTIPFATSTPTGATSTPLLATSTPISATTTAITETLATSSETEHLAPKPKAKSASSPAHLAPHEESPALLSGTNPPPRVVLEPVTPEKEGLFKHLWRAIVSFFADLF